MLLFCENNHRDPTNIVIKPTNIENIYLSVSFTQGMVLPRVHGFRHQFGQFSAEPKNLKQLKFIHCTKLRFFDKRRALIIPCFRKNSVFSLGFLHM